MDSNDWKRIILGALDLIEPNRSARVKFIFLFLEILVIVSAFLFENLFALSFTSQFPDVTIFSGYGWVFIPGILIIIMICLFLLLDGGRFRKLFGLFRNEWALTVLLGIAIVSCFWTVYFAGTLYRLCFLLFATFIGSYLVIRYKVEGIINLITYTGAFCVVAGWLMVIFTPFGVMMNIPFTGSWKGLFWHRNHSGSLMAFFGAVFLVRLLGDPNLRTSVKYMLTALYALATIHVYFSRSATGIIIFLLLNFSGIVGLAWLKWNSRLKHWHYYIALVVALAGAVAIAINTPLIFGLLGRSANMTGRIPLWQDLFQNVYLKKPLFGYGYGALWAQESFRVLMQAKHGWMYPVYFADNGFFDILLNLGLAGFIPFIVLFILAGVRAFIQVLTHKSWSRLMIFLIWLYIFCANLTYSFLLEVDQFVWMLLILVVFITSQVSPSFESADPRRENIPERMLHNIKRNPQP